MKKLIIPLLLVMYAVTSYAQNADEIVGVWWNAEKTSKIQVEKKDGKYIGTVVYIIPEKYENGQPPKDDKNPNPALRNRSKIGILILEGFVYNTNEKNWENGRIYDPNNGKTYDCYAWLEGKDLLKLKGFILGMRWLGRSSEWYRTTI